MQRGVDAQSLLFIFWEHAMNLKQFFILLLFSTTLTLNAMEEKDNGIIWTYSQSATNIDNKEVLKLVSSLANNLKGNAPLIISTIAHAPQVAQQALITIIETITPHIMNSLVLIITNYKDNLETAALTLRLRMNLRNLYISPLMQIMHQTLTNDYHSLIALFSRNQEKLCVKVAPLLLSNKVDLAQLSSAMIEFKNTWIQELKSYFNIKTQAKEENNSEEEEEEEKD